MKFVLLFGPQAVGKMTVGHELAKLTEYKLFHNHMTIDLVLNFFEFGSKSFNRLNNMFRYEIFKEAARSDLKGLIFTYVWAFSEQEDWEFVEEICSIFESEGGEVYFVELEADMEVRVARNKTPDRLKQKPTKRNIDFSERELKESMNQYRLNSKPGEIKRSPYIRINNTDKRPEDVARIIKDQLQL
ncbi:AAA domain-containing protein [Salinibacillus kushneri]|uniref:AAA domain-containing protein n=1 Tax=Salinibacillus kushneri TaxID=237682 RepID=A0A1I0DZC6_9BACI|nr:AAA family ATPase [Salinibacillus kushneri]SET37224.1 AAA domain-containing protein [Salinibacillus kushneri]